MNAVRRRRTIVAMTISVIGILALLVGVGVYGLLRGPSATRNSATPSSSDTIAPTTAAVAEPRPLAPSPHSEVFARTVAARLLTWDTRSSAGPSEWAQVLVDVGDDEEVAGLASDVRAYLPSPEQWEQISTYGTRQWLTIGSVRVPDSWATAVAQAAPGQLPPGAIAYTIAGIRHRAGTWADQPTTTESAVTFTVFIACPRAEDCRLLRLSRLDEPLG